MVLSTLTQLFIFEMANNHMGDVEFGLRIIRAFHDVAKDFPGHFAFKFQYRNLDTFIHPAYRERTDYKFVKRFSETRLSPDDFLRLRRELDRLGMLAICTGFDEASIDLIEDHGYDIIKIASCSFTDWPLLERVVRTPLPIIASCAGESLDAIDQVVSFFEHRQRDFALMHCVAEYPTPLDKLSMNQIDLLRARYATVPIGFSTHESPEQTDPIKLAIAKGAVMFEKHVGLPENGVTLNAYSASPTQVASWLAATQEAFAMCGDTGTRYMPSDGELASLHGLRRGAFARRAIKPGERITVQDVMLAIPTQEGQITANDLSKYRELTAESAIEPLSPILFEDVHVQNIREEIYQIAQEIRALISRSGVVIPHKVDLEISHHYGVELFAQYGLVMLSVINREYCKKYLAMLPDQRHPEQYHKHKEETFLVLYGDVSMVLDGVEQQYHPGDVITIERGVKHAFSTPTGAIMEEISTTHHKDDSYYTDPAIAANTNRKTFVTYWMDSQRSTKTPVLC